MRKNAGLTQAQVAAVMEVSQARVSQIEHGKITEMDRSVPMSRPSAGRSNVIWPSRGNMAATLIDPNAIK